jgi:TPR repeat protein
MMISRSSILVFVVVGIGVALIVTAGVYQRHSRMHREPKARIELQDECDSGSGESCYELGLMWGNGEGGPRDASKARELVARACELGAAKACGFLPMMR